MAFVPYTPISAARLNAAINATLGITPALQTVPQVSPPVPQTAGVRVAAARTTPGQPSPVPVAQTSPYPGNPRPFSLLELKSVITSGAYGAPGAAQAYVGPVTLPAVTLSPLVLVGGLALAAWLVFGGGE